METVFRSTILEILAALAALLRFPDWTILASVQDWCKKLVAAGKILVAFIPGTIDDKLIDALERIVVSDEAFAILYSILMDLINNDSDDNLLKADARVNTLATKVGLPITTILAIVAFLYKLYLKWKEQQNA